MTRKTALWMALALAAALAGAGCGGGDDDGAGDGGADTDADTDTDVDGGDTDLECTDDDMYWIYDLSVMPPADTQVCAHLRGEGDTVRVLVADDAWGSTVDAAMVEGLIAAWDDATPADPERGLFAVVTDAFGAPPDAFDADPRVWLFLYEMEGYMGYSFDGYFKVEDQLDVPTSNRHEMLHVNSLSNPPDGDYSLSVQAHELQHLIHFGHDQNEAAFVNESMSELAMVLTGFGADESWVASWLNDPTDPLMMSGPDYNYGVFLLFGDYLYERFGAEFIAALVADAANGDASLDALLGALDEPTTFADALGDLGLAIAVNDPTLAGGEYGFELIDIDPPDAAAFSTTETADVTVPGDGGFAFFTSADEAAGLAVRLVTDAPDALRVRIAFDGPSSSQLVEATLTGTTTDVDVDPWLAGADLWVAATNASGADVSLQVSLI